MGARLLPGSLLAYFLPASTARLSLLVFLLVSAAIRD
jgi:hypothetical protein